MTEQCTEINPSWFSRESPAQCQKFLDENGRHKGDHQAFVFVPAKPGNPRGFTEYERKSKPPRVDLESWSIGGGARHSGINFETLQQCVFCGDWFDPAWWSLSTNEFIVKDGYCLHCILWHTRAELFDVTTDKARQVRPHGSDAIYTWSPGHSGAFGGRRYVVTWDDGEVRGPGDFLWYGGVIPWEWMDRFPENGSFEQEGRVLRPGHTDTFGRPLEFNGDMSSKPVH